MAENNEDVQDTAPTTGDTQDASQKAFLTGKYKGQDYSWQTADEARAHAQKGLDYEKKKAVLETEVSNLRKDSAEFQRFEAWRNSLAQDPQRAAAVERAYNDPQSVLNPRGDDDLGGELPSQRPTFDPAVAELKDAVRQLQDRLTSQSAADAAKSEKESLGRAADSFDFLSKAPEARDLVISKAKVLMSEDSDLGPEAAVRIAAEGAKTLLRAQSQAKLDSKDAKANLKTVDPNSGTQTGSLQERTLDPERPRRGALRTAVLNELQSGKWREKFPNF